MNRLIFFLSLVACHLSLSGQIHADLKPYHDRFISEAKARGITTMPVAAPSKMQFFKKEKTNIQGGCFFEDKAVYFNQTYWNNANDENREIIVFHELAHYYFHAGHIRHYKDDIMNPNAEFDDYAATRNNYLDLLFLKIYDTPIDRHDLTLRAGDIIITSDNAESETFRIYTIKDDTSVEAARSLAIIDSIQKTHLQFDYINAKGWRMKPYEYIGMDPVIRYDAVVSEVWGETNRMYMFSDSKNKAPRLGANARVRWSETTAMTLVIDYKTTTIPINRKVTIMYYVKQRPNTSEGRKEINLP